MNILEAKQDFFGPPKTTWGNLAHASIEIGQIESILGFFLSDC